MQRLALAALTAFPLAAAGALAVPTGPQETEGVQVGEIVDFNFRQPILGAMGESSMSEFRGKPVLIDFWGTK